MSRTQRSCNTLQHLLIDIRRLRTNTVELDNFSNSDLLEPHLEVAHLSFAVVGDLVSLVVERHPTVHTAQQLKHNRDTVSGLQAVRESRDGGQGAERSKISRMVTLSFKTHSSKQTVQCTAHS